MNKSLFQPHPILPSLLLAIANLLLLLVGCSPQAEYFGNIDPPQDSIFRFNVGPEPEYLDPALSTSLYDARISVLLYEGLTAKDPKTLQPRPGVAERWDITHDGLTYTFHLRADALWSDGQPVTAHDFVYSWTRVLTPATGARYAAYLYPIVNAAEFNQGKLADPSQLGVRALDERTLEVRLNDPVPYFLYLTGFQTYYPVPRPAVEQYGDRWTDPSHIITNGPYLLVEHHLHAYMLLERNPRYWNRQEVRTDRIIAFTVDDARTATNMYEAGMLDWLPYPSVPPDFLPYMRGRFRDLMTFPQIGLMYYGLNTTRPPLDDVLVRRALTLALDRPAITEGLLRGGEIPTDHFVPAGFPGYPAPPPPVYDPEQASQLLSEAGYPNGQGFPALEILVPPDRRTVAEAAQQMWAKNLNIHLTIHSEEFSSFLKRWAQIDYDIAGSRWIGDYLDPSTFTDLMESTNGNNNTGYKSPEYDRLLAEARFELDPFKRLELLQRAEALMLKDSPVIPIYIMAANELVKPYVRGIYPAMWDVLPLNQVWIDRQWQDRGGPREAHRTDDGESPVD
ncbi:MAG: peptide ABC transporter substrate-binding protein [Acidobacteria bacterium]|nr:peptide ABC transporter substrate-binding protein [Acidobacteriota bacterium]